MRVLAAIGLLALSALPAAALPDVTAPGPHAVGTTNITFTKTSETTGQPRVLDTKIWYPAPGPSAPTITVQPNAPVLRGRWPLVMFSHGSCGIPGQSEFYTAALASWGFVVAAPPHPGNTTLELPECSSPAVTADSFANRVADIEFVANQLLAANHQAGSPFAKRLNPRRLGMTGHSFGGQTTLRVAAADHHMRGAVALAPATEGITDLSIRVPTMVITGELDSLTPFETDARTALGLLHGPRFLIELLNTGHCAFTVLCAPSLCGAGCEPGTLSLADGHHLALRYGVAFFLRYVAGKRRFGALLRPANALANSRLIAAHPRP